MIIIFPKRKVKKQNKTNTQFVFSIPRIGFVDLCYAPRKRERERKRENKS
jgi:hypothetical protein